MNIPKNILDQFKAEADKVYPKGYTTSGNGFRNESFPVGAAFGYSLSQSELTDLLEWIAIFYGALSELIEVKRIKDIYGKSDPDYLERQPKAWHLAKQGIELWKLSDYGAKPLSILLAEKDKRIEELNFELLQCKETLNGTVEQSFDISESRIKIQAQLTEANKEITRLNGLIEKEVKNNALSKVLPSTTNEHAYVIADKTWEQFKAENNL